VDTGQDCRKVVHCNKILGEITSHELDYLSRTQQLISIGKERVLSKCKHR